MVKICTPVARIIQFVHYGNKHNYVIKRLAHAKYVYVVFNDVLYFFSVPEKEEENYV